MNKPIDIQMNVKIEHKNWQNINSILETNEKTLLTARPACRRG